MSNELFKTVDIVDEPVKLITGGGLGGFAIKDSGKREKFASGMVRDVVAGKLWWSLVADGPMLQRWAVHLTKGAIKYAARNWMLADGEAEYERFKDSAFRHFMQWYLGDLDEDHAAATIFNINGAEYVKERREKGQNGI